MTPPLVSCHISSENKFQRIPCGDHAGLYLVKVCPVLFKERDLHRIVPWTQIVVWLAVSKRSKLTEGIQKLQ
jgi:hypothetical protein